MATRGRQGERGSGAGPAPDGAARSGQGGVTRRPGPPLPRFLAAPRPAPVCAAAAGARDGPATRLPGVQSGPGRVRGPPGPGRSRPRPHSAPSRPFPRTRQRPRGVARYPCARASRGASLSPLPGYGPRGLDAAAAAAPSRPGAEWRGPRGPVSTGRGGRRAPSRSARPVGRPRRLSGCVPACSRVPGALSILHGGPGRPARSLGSSSCHYGLAPRRCVPGVTGEPWRFSCPPCSSGLLLLLSWVFPSLTPSLAPSGPWLPPFHHGEPPLALWVSSCTRGPPPSDCTVVPPPLCPVPGVQSLCTFAGDLRLLVQRWVVEGLQSLPSLGPLLPPPTAAPTFLGITPYFPPWYSMVLPVFAEAETAAGRALCQAPACPTRRRPLILYHPPPPSLHWVPSPGRVCVGGGGRYLKRAYAAGPRDQVGEPSHCFLPLA